MDLINGNVTHEGITADLEAMKRVGIGGFQLYNIAMGVPLGPYDFMSPEWRKMVKLPLQNHSVWAWKWTVVTMAGGVVTAADRGSRPRSQCKKWFFSEKEITGPKEVSEKIPSPERIKGYYEDICVLGFPKVGAYRIKNLATKATADPCHSDGPASRYQPGGNR